MASLWHRDNPSISMALRDFGYIVVAEQISEETQLHFAAGRGNINLMQKIFEGLFDVDVKDSHGRTPAFLAAYGGHIAALEMLLDKEASLETLDEDGVSILMAAAMGGNIGMVEYLMEREDVDLLSETKSGKTALGYSCVNNHAEIVKLLVTKENKLLAQTDNKGRTVMMDCAGLGNLSMLKLLHSMDVPLDTIDRTGDTALILSAKAGSTQCIEFLLNNGINAHHKNHSGQTAFMEAIVNEHSSATELLHKKGSLLDEKSMAGNSVMDMGLISKNTEIANYFKRLHGEVARLKKCFLLVDMGNLKALKEASCDVNAKNSTGHTLLMVACDKGFPEIVEYLCKKGACVSELAPNGMTACEFAIRSKTPEETIKVLKAYGADINRKDANGQTILFKAAKAGWLGCLKILERVKADLEIPDNHGKTPLIVASEKNHGKLVQYLLNLNVDTTAKDDYGKTALEYASQEIQIVLEHTMGKQLINEAEKDDLARIELLLESKAPPNYQDPARNNTTPLIEACKTNNFNMVYCLCEGGANPNVRDDLGKMPLMYACDIGRHRLAEYLITKGAMVDAVELYSSLTSLHLACHNGHVDIVRLLLSNRADTEIANADNRTALITACCTKNVEVVAELCKVGANVNHTDCRGHTPLMVASHFGDFSSVKILVEHKARLSVTSPKGWKAIDFANKAGHAGTVNWLHLKMMCMPEVRSSAVTSPEHVDSNFQEGPCPNTNPVDYEGMIMALLQEKHCTLARVKELLDGNPSCNFIGENSKNALHCCSYIESGDAPEIIELLVEYGFDVDEQDPDGNTALFECCINGNINVAKKLIELNADVSIESNSSSSSLVEACVRNYVTLVSCLIDHEKWKREILDTCLAFALANTFFDIAEVITEECGLHSGDGMPSLTDFYQCPRAWRPLGGLDSKYMHDSKSKTYWLKLVNKEGCYETEKLLSTIEDRTSSVIEVDEHVEDNWNASEYEAHVQNPVDDFGTIAKFFFMDPERFRQRIRSYIQGGDTTNKRNPGGIGMLHVAVIKQDLSAIKWLLHFGADVDIMDRQKVTPLQLALKLRLPEAKQIVHMLLQQGADTQGCVLSEDAGIATMIKKYSRKQNGFDKDGLFRACREGKNIAPGKLIINFARTARGDTLLNVAVQESQKETIQFLLEQNANPNKGNSHGKTPLMHASKNGKVDICKLLLDFGAETCFRESHDGLCALRLAVDGCHIEVIKCLLEYSADPDQEDFCKRTSLHRACLKGNIEVVQTLIHHGADINHRDNNGYTPLMIAVERMNNDLVSTLCDSGADISLKDHNGKTATELTDDEQILALLKSHLHVQRGLKDIQHHTEFTDTEVWV